MFYQEILPPVRLRPFIRHYFHNTMDIVLDNTHTDIVVPNLAAGITICYQLKENIQLIHKQTSNLAVDLPRSNILPPLTEKSIFLTKGGFRMIGVVFQPGALFKIFKVPLSEFTEKVLDTESTLGPEMRELEERVVEARDLQERLEIMNRYFLWKLSKTDPKTGYIDAAFKWLPTQESLRVKDLGLYMHVTTRHLRRIFRDHIGISPKKCLQILRFSRAFQQLNKQSEIFLTALSHEFGYYDQAHFIHEFKQFIGCTPSAYMKERSNLGSKLAWKEEID